MKRLYPKTPNQLAHRCTVLINQIDRHQPRQYPGLLYLEVHLLVRRTEGLVDRDPFEEEVIQIAKTLAENCELKIALFKLREVIQQRLEGRD